MNKFPLIFVITGIVAFGLTMATGFLAPPLPPDFTLPEEFTPPETGAIRPFPMVNFTELKHFDWTRFFGYPLGNLVWLIMVRFVLTSIWFVLAVFFLSRYTKGFYGPREIPLSWSLLLSGMIITNIAEIGENLVFHTWPYLGIFEHNFLLILPHLWGGFLIGLGGWYLLKEVKP
jgi:hypothetical protein